MAGNLARGAVAFTGADGRPYTLRYTVDALCRVEAALGCGVAEMEARLTEGRLTDLRAIFFEGLVDRGDLDMVTAGELVGPAQMGVLVSQAIAAAFPPPDEAAAGN